MNTNPLTGLRYGVIALDSLDPYIVEDLWYGPGARNISEEVAAEELRKELKARYNDALESVLERADNRVFANIVEREDYIADEMMGILKSPFIDTEQEYVDDAFERECDFMIDEPWIEGTYEGVRYAISWLGGAPLLWSFDGPEAVAERLCSPCVPGAADLDGDFTLASEMLADGVDYSAGYGCHAIPRDWLRKVEA